MLQTHIEAFNRLSGTQKRNVYIVLVLCFVFGLLVTVVYQSKFSAPVQKVPAKTQQTSTVGGSATVNLSASSLTVTKAVPFTVTVTLDSGRAGVEAADFAVSYDPRLLQVETIADGSYFKTWPIKKVEEGLVKLSGIASLDGNTLTIPQGKGTVATIRFIPTGSSAETTIALHPQKTVIASKGKNILDTGSLKELKITIE